MAQIELIEHYVSDRTSYQPAWKNLMAVWVESFFLASLFDEMTPKSHSQKALLGENVERNKRQKGD